MADNPPHDPSSAPPVTRGDASVPAPVKAADVSSPPLAAPPAPRGSRWPSREFLLITGGVIVGLVLGIYRTKIRDSVGVLEELWTLASPVIATVASTVLGSVFQEHGFKGALAKRWGSVLLLSVLLTLSAEGFVRAAKDLAVGRRAEPATVQSAPPPLAPAPAIAAPQPAAAPLKADDARTKAPESRSAATPTPRASAPVRSDATLARCSELNARGSIGEILTAEERDFLARNCRK